MNMSKNHKWIFRARFRKHAFGWRDQPAISRVKEAVSEIKKVARKDPVLGGEGAVMFLEKLVPAIEHVDGSSGAIGNTVKNAIRELVLVISDAPAGDDLRDAWIEKLWNVMLDEDMGYLDDLGDYWGEMCVTPERASKWADELLPELRASWARKKSRYFKGTTACLSCMLSAGRYQELLDLIETAPFVWWNDRKFGVRALVAMGKKSEAISYAEASKGLSDSLGPIHKVCEEILLSSGLVDEAYERYALHTNLRMSNLATFRAIAKKYPHKEKKQILNDLIESSPGSEGKWFATAKNLGMYDLAINLANRSPCEPKTLNRAAKAHIKKNPEFALETALTSLHWLAEDYGYKITSHDVQEAHNYAMKAAEKLGKKELIQKKIRKIVENDRSTGKFVQKSLGREK